MWVHWLLWTLVAIVLAGPARAAMLPFTGTLSVEITTLPPIVATGSGIATLNGEGGLGALSSVAFGAGAFAGAVSIPITDPAALPIEGVAGNAGNGAASFSLGGPMALQGLAKICLFGACNGSPVSNLDIPFTQNGTRGVGLGGLPIVVNGVVQITVQGAPWTTGVATFGTITRAGFVHGPASGGASSAAAVSGALRLVTPIRLSTNIGAAVVLPAYGILDLHFVPEPGTLVLLATGVGGLAAVGRWKMRRARVRGGAAAR